MTATDIYPRRSDYEKILDLQSALHNSGERFPETALRKLRDDFGFTHLAFFLVDQNGRFFEPHGINFSREALKSYCKYYYAHDPIYHRNAAKTPFANRDTVLLNELLPLREFEKSEYYNDFFKKCDFYYEVGIYLKSNGRHIGAMGAMRPKNENNFSKRDHVLLNTITTIIAQQLDYYLGKKEIQEREQLYKSSFFHNPLGVMILDESLGVLDANAAAVAYCGDIKGGAPRSMEKVISDVFNSNLLKNQGDAGLTFFGYGGYSIDIIPTFAVGRIKNRFNVNYLVYIRNGDCGQKSPGTEACLTGRELEIADLAARGFTNKEIASALIISPQTVRTHFDNIFTKLKVNNRVEMLCKLGRIV